MGTPHHPRPLVAVTEAIAAILATTLTADQLRVLADAMRSDDMRVRNRRSIGADAVAELAELVAAGRTPTVGWWRHRRAEHEAQLAEDRRLPAHARTTTRPEGVAA